MKYCHKVILVILTNILFTLVSGLTSIEFQSTAKYLNLENKNEFLFGCNYKRNSQNQYLYLYPQNYIKQINKVNFKIYFKEIENIETFEDSSLNYLYSDYSSIDFNSGLFISLSKLHYDTAILYIHSYETLKFKLFYKYADSIIFPEYAQYSNFQLNQFILPKDKTETIDYTIRNQNNNYLLILSKTSLRNIEVALIYDQLEAVSLDYLYPNGCSVFLDYDKMDNVDIKVSIKNKNNHDEVILLGTVHHINDEIFPNEIVNGFQLYIEGNKNDLNNLLITSSSGLNQYFSTQIYNKDLLIYFNDDSYPLTDYNSMFPYAVSGTNQKISFSFGISPKRSALYFQYIDYANKEIAQKSLQSLVTGVPKAMKIPENNYMYHFLPKERLSNNLFFYLRPKTHEKIYISFKSCVSYPDNCSFIQNGTLGSEVIQNIGLWYTLPRKDKELNLILAYCAPMIF